MRYLRWRWERNKTEYNYVPQEYLRTNDVDGISDDIIIVHLNNGQHQKEAIADNRLIDRFRERFCKGGFHRKD